MDRSPSSFEEFAADRLVRDSDRITALWVERISAQLGVRPRGVLPKEDLLDNIPRVLSRAADFLLAPVPEKITAQQDFTEDLKNIARLRRRQGDDAQEIIREFDVLALLLDEVAEGWLDAYPGTPDPKGVGRVFGRLNRAPLLMGEVTVGTYQEEEMDSRYTAARQIREFAEMLSRQLKTPLGAAEGAALLLENEEITSDPVERQRFAALIRRNIKRARTVVDDVHALAFAQLAHS